MNCASNSKGRKEGEMREGRGKVRVSEGKVEMKGGTEREGKSGRKEHTKCPVRREGRENHK